MHKLVTIRLKTSEAQAIVGNMAKMQRTGAFLSVLPEELELREATPNFPVLCLAGTSNNAANIICTRFREWREIFADDLTHYTGSTVLQSDIHVVTWDRGRPDETLWEVTYWERVEAGEKP